MTTPVSVIKSVLPPDASSATKQDQIKQAIEEAFNNEYHYQSSISLTQSVVSYTQTRDTQGYNDYSVIVEDTLGSTSFQVQWSPDDITYYYADYSNSTFQQYDVDGVSSQYIGSISPSKIKARYFRVALYNSTGNTTVNVITTLVH